MIRGDLTKHIKTSIKTAQGQLEYILTKIDDEDQAENILLQLKAVQSTLTKSTFELLDNAYRKALAEKISSAHANCPGNCGQEDAIEILRILFPEIKPEDVPGKLKEAQRVEDELKRFLNEKSLDTPRGTV